MDEITEWVPFGVGGFAGLRTDGRAVARIACYRGWWEVSVYPEANPEKGTLRGPHRRTRGDAQKTAEAIYAEAAQSTD